MVVDPTQRLLEQVPGFESRFPWVLIGLLAILLLWLPSAFDLDREFSTTLRESEWIADALSTEDGQGLGSAFARAVTRLTVRLEEGPTGYAPEVGASGAALRRAVRLPSVIASILGLLVFFALARLIVRDAAGLVAAVLLAASTTWLALAANAYPLLVGETLMLAGVAWGIALLDRHHEVSVAGRTALKIGLGGFLFGIALVVAPATFPTFLTALIVWLSLGIHRAHATILPVENPRRIVGISILGSLFLLVVTFAVAALLEQVLHGQDFELFLAGRAAPGLGIELWGHVYRTLLSPGPATDQLVVFVILVVLVIRFLEWWRGHPWRAGGLLPWAFQVLFVLALGREASREPGLQVPLSVPPLFLLGLGWLYLRGLVPGRVHRQEYTFLLVWIGIGALLLPLLTRLEPLLPKHAAVLTVLPGMLLVAGRGARALWQAETTPLARIGVLVFVFLSPLVVLLEGFANLGGAAAGLSRTAAVLGNASPVILAIAAGLGALSVLVTVRPDVGAAAEPSANGRRRRPTHRRRGNGNRRGARRDARRDVRRDAGRDGSQGGDSRRSQSRRRR